MKKRFLSAFLALALIVSLCPTAFAASGQIKASLSSAQVKQGEKVSIQFKLDENPGFVSTNIQVNWPKDDLTLMAVSGTDTITGWMGEPIPPDGKTDGKYVLSWQNNTILSNITTTGVLCTLEFATLSSGSVGEKEITLSTDGPGQEFTNYDMETVNAVLTGGKITITSATSSDLSVAITKPVTGRTPETAINGTNYIGSITWTPGLTSGGKFAASTEYTANVTLTAKGSYQFDNNVKPTVTDATSVTVESVAPDGKTLTFKAKFPKTDTKTLKDIDIITNPELKLAVPTAAPNATATNERSLAVTGVYDDGSGGPVAVNWEFMATPGPKGVYLVGSTLKVTNEAEAGTFMIKATSIEGGYTDSETVTITKETAKETHIVATHPATGTNITIPNVGTKTSGSCSYKFYDQYGAEMPGIGATWKMKLEPTTVTGVTLTTDGAIAVTNDATTCTATVYAEGSGVKSNEITFNIAREASVATSLTIEGSADSVTVPTVSKPGTTECAYATYTAKVKDQYGQVMTGEPIAWSVPENPGVTFNNGQLTVTNKANAGTVTITATSGTLTATKDVTINKDTPKETFVKITAQDNEPPVTLIICTGSQRSESYTATVYDQYGNEKQDNVEWSLDPALSGVTHEISETNDNIVTLKVAPDTAEGTFKLVATSKTITTVKGELEIKVQKKTDVSDKINFANGSLTYNGKGQKHENAALDSSVAAGTGSHWAYTYAVKGGTASLDGGLPKTVGTYNVTATYEDSKNVGSKTVELTIGPKEVTVSSGITAENKVYDGENTATVNADGATFTGKVDGDELMVSVTSDSTFDSADVGSRTVTLGTLTLSGASAGNYTLATEGNQTTTTADITRRDLTVTPEPNQSKKFGEEDPTMLSYLPTGAVEYQNPDFTGKLSRAEGDAVGQYDITLGDLALKDNGAFKASNYTLKLNSTPVKFEIKKADAPTLPDISVSQKYTVTTEQSKDIGRAGMPEKAGALTYTKGTASKAGSVKIDSWSVDSTTGKVSYKLSNGAADDTVTLPVIIGSVNYENSTVNVKITLTKPSYSGGGSGSYTPSYTVSVDKTENGTITISPKSASKGDTVTITVKPDKGYELDTLKVLDKDGDKVKLTEKNGKYTFKMPSGKVTVKGSFVEEAPVQIFKDVPTDAYYYEAVKWAAEKGITGGVGNGLFAPNQPCTRAQIVTFLWRAAGSPAPKSMSSFADVPADAFYAKAVAWAVENGITGGTGDGKFSPDATCTRAQSVTFLYRAAGSPKVSSSAEFGDVATNTYYADAVAWAAKNGITGGIGGGLFGSNNDCTRAQIVTFLYRCVK